MVNLSATAVTENEVLYSEELDAAATLDMTVLAGLHGEEIRACNQMRQHRQDVAFGGRCKGVDVTEVLRCYGSFPVRRWVQVFPNLEQRSDLRMALMLVVFVMAWAPALSMPELLSQVSNGFTDSSSKKFRWIVLLK
jgi:hypothetical protein